MSRPRQFGPVFPTLPCQGVPDEWTGWPRCWCGCKARFKDGRTMAPLCGRHAGKFPKGMPLPVASILWFILKETAHHEEVAKRCSKLKAAKPR